MTLEELGRIEDSMIRRQKLVGSLTGRGPVNGEDARMILINIVELCEQSQEPLASEIIKMVDEALEYA